MLPKELAERLEELRAVSRSVLRLWNELQDEHDDDAQEGRHHLLADRLDEDLVGSICEKVSDVVWSFKELADGVQLEGDD